MDSPTQPMSDPNAADEMTGAAADRSFAPAVLRSSALQIGGHGIAIALTAASTIILTRFLGVEGYGSYTILTVFLLLGVSISEFGLNGTAVRWFARGEQPEEIFASLIGLRLVLSFAAALTGVTLFLLYPEQDAPASAVMLTALAMLLAGVNMTIPTALQARLDFRLGVVLDLTARVIALATYVAVAVLITSPAGDDRLVAATVGLPLGYLVAVVVGLFAVKRLSFPIVPTFHPATWRRLMRDALPLGIVTILGLASYRLDAVVLAILQESRDVGIYGLAYRFMEAAVPLGAFIVAVVYPVLVRDAGGKERRAMQVARAADLLLIISVAAAVATVVLAPDLVRILGGPEFAPAVVPLRILALSLPFTFMGMLLSWTLVARGLQRRLIPVAAAAVTLNLTLNVALVPTYSYKASAAITLTTEAFGAIVLTGLVRHWIGATPSLSSVARIASSGAIALMVGLLAASAGGIVGTIVALGCFGGLVLAFRLVTREELNALIRRR